MVHMTTIDLEDPDTIVILAGMAAITAAISTFIGAIISMSTYPLTQQMAKDIGNQMPMPKVKVEVPNPPKLWPQK